MAVLALAMRPATASGPLFPNPVLACPGGPSSIAAGDFDHDGLLDLAVTNQWADRTSVFLSRGEGEFGAATGADAGDQPVALTVGDLNADGDSDIAVLNHASDDVSVLYGRGDGSFEPQARLPTGIAPPGDDPTIHAPLALAIGDFDADGAPDLAVAHTLGKEIWILPNRRPDRDGDGHRPPADCDESDGAIHPGAIDLPGNVVAEDCDGDPGDCDPCLPWVNHGHFVRCVARALGDRFAGGLLSAERRAALLRSAAASDIGNRDGGSRCGR